MKEPVCLKQKCLHGIGEGKSKCWMFLSRVNDLKNFPAMEKIWIIFWLSLSVITYFDCSCTRWPWHCALGVRQPCSFGYDLMSLILRSKHVRYLGPDWSESKNQNIRCWKWDHSEINLLVDKFTRSAKQIDADFEVNIFFQFCSMELKLDWVNWFAFYCISQNK